MLAPSSNPVLAPICGISRITDVDAFTFDRFKELRINASVSPAGVNRDLAVYRAAFNFAVERRLLMCCDLRLRTLIMVLVDTGMRVGIEALKLKWIDVDFEESIITVTQSKTTAGLRPLPMTPLVKSALLEWRVVTNGISEHVFFNPQRPSVHILSVKTAWHNALRMAGLPPFPIYQCRHT